MFNFDMHVHTLYSGDAVTHPKEAIKVALKRKLSGIAITDHGTIKGARSTMKYRIKEFLVIPGVEMKTRIGHLLLLNITEEPPPNINDLNELADWIHSRNGIIVLAHPFNTPLTKSRKLNEKVIDALEVMNSNAPLFHLHYKMSVREALMKKLGVSAGSDSHIPETIGSSFISFFNKPNSVEEALTMMVKRKCSVHGKRIGINHRLLKLTMRLKRFIH